ncbi:MAG: sulfatase-like hydrolase/transferase, partial [Bacteroidales bacterium]|nr:sulfatase-like hydrolase/transferase [Bacteroidales bacterium]
DQPPNIVIIMADDQGYADLGCYGAEGFATPNIDGMAAEGMRFTSFYVSQAVCSASRAALLTGCYSERVSILGALMPWTDYGLNPQETTIAEILKSAGYATGIFGKWHLGHQDPFLPLQNGFDEYLGLPYSNDMWPVGYDGEPLTEENPGPKPRKLEYPQLPLIDGNEKVEEIRTLDDQATLTTRYTERAVQFIEKNRDRPFFLYVPHSMPHVPLGVSEKFKGKSEQGKYGDVIMEIDWSVGKILQALKRNKLDKNTLVIYLSDNGPWLNYGNHAGSAKPLREAKGTMLEGGPRVPCIMRWPDKIRKGVECNNIAASIDLLPTIAAITGAQLPANRIDGVNIISLLENQENANPRDSYYYYGGGLRAVRQGNWKLYFPHESRSYVGQIPGRDGFPGETTKVEIGLELYNLEKDLSEKNNVADNNPDIVKELKLLADEARQDLGDKLTDVEGQNIRPPGRIEESRSISFEDSTTLKQDLLDIVEKQDGVMFSRKEIGIINGRKLMAEIIEPMKLPSGNRPAIIFLHGGVYRAGTPDQFRAQAAFFASVYGCYTLSLDYSLTPEGRLWPEPVLETSYAIRWVRSIAEEKNIDPNQIVLSGGSAGGHLSGIVASNAQTRRYPVTGGLNDFSSHPDVLVIFNGYFDLVKYPLNRQIQQMIGSEDTKKVDAASKELSTMYHVDNNFPPVLQMVGTKDPFCKQSLEFHEKLQSLGVHSEIETYDDKGHGFFN